MIGSKLLVLGVLAGAFAMAACASEDPQRAPNDRGQRTVPSGMDELVVGGGCFWCIEPLFEELRGVVDVESGYAGGKTPNPTYEQVLGGWTGHAEVIRILFDPKQISADDLLRLFFVVHDPTELNKQGPDVGTQYRSVVFYRTPEEKTRVEKIIKEIADKRIWANKIKTTLEPLSNYTRAEEYHQDYYRKYELATPIQRLNMNSGYCAAIVEPKVAKFRKMFGDRLKKRPK